MNQPLSLIRRHWMPLLVLNSCILTATIIATVYARNTSQLTWMAQAQLNLPKNSNDTSLGELGVLRQTGLDFSREVNPLQLQATILTSDEVLERARSQDPEKHLYPNATNYKSLFKVAPLNQTTILAIESKGSSPQLARDRLNALIRVYLDRLIELRQNYISHHEQFFSDKLRDSQEELFQAQQALSQFQKLTGLIDSETQIRELVEAINDLRTARTNLLAQDQGFQARIQAAVTNLGMKPEAAMQSLRLGENREYQTTREKLIEINTTLAEARSNYTDDHPQVKSLLTQWQKLKDELNQYLTTTIPEVSEVDIDPTLGGSASRINLVTDLLRATVEARGPAQQARQLQNQIDTLNAELRLISFHQGQLADLRRRHEVAESVYKGVISQVEQAKANPFNAYPNIQILNESALNPNPVKPKDWLITIGGILAATFGSAALAIWLESRKPLLSSRDIQQVEFPVLMSLSRFKNLYLAWNLATDVEIEFQRLASVICSLHLNNHRLMVTSASFGEGKTTVTLGLAISLAKLGFQVLLVDADLRQAELSHRLGSALTQEREKYSLQKPLPLYSGLDLLPAPVIPDDKIGAFFVGGDFESRLKAIQAHSHYDYVLIDSPPVSLTSEAALMSAIVQNVLFVVRPGTSDRYSVMDSFEQLGHHQAKIMGLVVNGVESKAERYHYYGHQRELLEAEI